MRKTSFIFGSMLMLAALTSCNDKEEFDNTPPKVNKKEFDLSSSQTGKDTLYVTDKHDFKLHHIMLINKADEKTICEVNALSDRASKLEAGGVTYGEVKYVDGEASLIEIYHWGTLEKISTPAHKKAYAMTYTGKKPADMNVGLAVLGEKGGISVTIK